MEIGNVFSSLIHSVARNPSLFMQLTLTLSLVLLLVHFVNIKKMGGAGSSGKTLESASPAGVAGSSNEDDDERGKKRKKPSSPDLVGHPSAGLQAAKMLWRRWKGGKQFSQPDPDPVEPADETLTYDGFTFTRNEIGFDRKSNVLFYKVIDFTKEFGNDNKRFLADQSQFLKILRHQRTPDGKLFDCSTLDHLFQK